MTGREFFARFPTLHPFLLKQLEMVANTMERWETKTFSSLTARGKAFAPKINPSWKILLSFLCRKGATSSLWWLCNKFIPPSVFCPEPCSFFCCCVSIQFFFVKVQWSLLDHITGSIFHLPALLYKENSIDPWLSTLWTFFNWWPGLSLASHFKK